MLWGLISWASLGWTVLTAGLQWVFPSLIPGLTSPANMKWIMLLACIRWRWPTIVFGLLSLSTLKWCIFFSAFRMFWGWLERVAEEENDKENRGKPQAEDEGDSGSSSSFTSGARLRAVHVAGATGEIARILQSRDYYTVLEVPRAAEGPDIKKAYRSKQLATHPDKNLGAPGALEASQRVNQAYDTLSDTGLRRKYDANLKDDERTRPANPGPRSSGPSASRQDSQTDPSNAYQPRTERDSSVPPEAEEFFTAAYEAWIRRTLPEPPPGAVYPTIDPTAYLRHGVTPGQTFRMRCQCGYDHIATKMDRDACTGRICNCDRCGSFLSWSYLPAYHNDVWFEKIFMIRTAFRCVDDSVYEITEWAKCNGLMTDSRGGPVPCNTHYVPCRLMNEKEQSHCRDKRDANRYDQSKTDGNPFGNPFHGAGAGNGGDGNYQPGKAKTSKKKPKRRR